jgi:cytochrome c-type biogenesis protein CcmH/NrfF
MYPGRSIFRKREDEEARTDVAIRRAIAEDLYLVLAPDFDLGTQTITLQVVVNPLVDWIWFGFGVMAFGTGIALMPERAYSFAVARLPAEAATTTLGLLLVLLLGAAPLRAQTTDTRNEPAAADHVEDPNAAVTRATSPLEEELRHEMGCICGSCAHEPLSKCTCSYAKEMRANLREQINQGKNREQVIAAFIGIYGGQHFLTAPIDQGFNRLAWLLPYGLAGSGLVLVGIVAMRWSRGRTSTQTEAPAAADPDLEERLDDELRNLD